MTKGKPWDLNEIRQLRELVEEGKNIEEISQTMVKTKEAIRQKLMALDLKILKEQQQPVSEKKSENCLSRLELPAELPTVEKTLQILAAALIKGADAGLDKNEMQRLHVVAKLAKTYKEIFADYLDYRGLEERLIELEKKYESLNKKPQKNAPT